MTSPSPKMIESHCYQFFRDSSTLTALSAIFRFLLSFLTLFKSELYGKKMLIIQFPYMEIVC